VHNNVFLKLLIKAPITTSLLVFLSAGSAEMFSSSGGWPKKKISGGSNVGGGVHLRNIRSA